MVCTRCQVIPGELFDENDYVYNHSPTCGELRSSAKAGCNACAMLLASLVLLPGQAEIDDRIGPVTLHRTTSIEKGPFFSINCGRIPGITAIETDHGFKMGKTSISRRLKGIITNY